jgi:hypothetical protein
VTATQYTIVDAVGDALTGNLHLAQSEDVKHRRTICDTCDARLPVVDICSACGCVIAAKIRLQDSHCPMELW